MRSVHRNPEVPRRFPGGWNAGSTGPETRVTPGPLRVRRALVFTVAAATVTYLALRDGGYDLVVRHEAGLVVWAALALGFALGVFPRGKLSWIEGAPLIAAGGLALFMFLSLGWSDSSERTLDEISRVALYAGVFALCLFGLNRHTWRAAAAGIATGAVGVAAFAVATRLAPGSLPSAEVTVLSGRAVRLGYPLEYWNAVAAWAAIAGTMALAYSANLRSPLLRGLSLAAVPVAVSCVYLTYSRGGVIGTALGAIGVLALSRNRWTVVLHALVAAGGSAIAIAVIRNEPAINLGSGGDGGGAVAVALVAGAFVCGAAAAITASVGVDRVRLPRRLARGAVPVTAALLAVVALAIAGGAIADYWDEFQNQSTVSAGSDPAERLTSGGGTRRDVWDSGLDAFSSEPLRGIGPGTFEYYWSEHAGAGGGFLRDAHSLYIEELAELGLPGLLLLIGFLGGGLALAIRARVRVRRSSEIAAAAAMSSGAIVFLVAAGVDWMWELTALSVLGIGAIGIGMAARVERDPKRRMAPRARIAATVVALGIALIQIPGLVSTARIRESGEALADGHVSEARALAGEAIDAEPWGATGYEARAAAEVEGGDYDAARADVERAIDKEPSNWRHRLALVQIELAAGHEGAARAAFGDLAEISLPSEVPYESVTAMARDPLVRQTTRVGCLAYRFGTCGYGRVRESRPTHSQPRCIESDNALAAIRDVRGVQLTALRVVKVPVLNADPIIYAAGYADGTLTTWAVDPKAYRTGFGAVIPLDDAARQAMTLGTPIDPALFSLSPADEGAVAARSCAQGAAE
jgi:hypothetical protein